MFGGGSDAAGGIDDAMGKMDQLKASERTVAGTACCAALLACLHRFALLAVMQAGHWHTQTS